MYGNFDVVAIQDAPTLRGWPWDKLVWDDKSYTNSKVS